jgi:hypothetical protein
LLADQPYPGLIAFEVTRVMRHVSMVLGPLLAVASVTVAMIGTVAACWLGSLAVLEASGVHSTPVVRFFCASCTLAGLASELIKLALAPQLGEQIAGRRRWQTVVLVLWGSCIMYGSLMPILLLMNVPIWPAAGGAVFALSAISWAFTQLMSGLLPAVNWTTSSPAVTVDHFDRSEWQSEAGPASRSRNERRREATRPA